MKDKLKFLQQRREITTGVVDQRVLRTSIKGKQTARERLEQFLYPGSFVEVGTLCKATRRCRH